MIKIGVTPCMMYEDEKRSSFAPKRLNYMVEDMGRYLRRNDVLPILIPSLPSAEMRKMIGQMDGIVFQGGDDIAPQSYKEEPIGQWKGDVQRDLIELEIMKFALELDKPIFAICRGMQLMNIYFGGTLYQDIATQFDTNTVHKGSDYDQHNHEIKLKEGSYLEKINGKQFAVVNSIHHQGIKDLANSLEAIAWDKEEGIIEAVQIKNIQEGRVMGVQWHPEYDWNHTENMFPAEKLYDHFLNFCG